MVDSQLHEEGRTLQILEPLRDITADDWCDFSKNGHSLAVPVSKVRLTFLVYQFNASTSTPR
jgi:hypothetical protein